MEVKMKTRSIQASTGLAAAALALMATFASPAIAAPNGDDQLVQPRQLIVDHSLPPQRLAAQIRAARLYDTFWTTGDEAQAREALAPDFMDRTLPPGRPQGLAGPLAASKGFHAAVPDVHAEVEQMIVAGDRVITHLRFRGHFSGSFQGVQGKGQPVDFIATDIYRIRDGRIAENWHLEDNLTFLRQLGVVKP
ncbi:ester cyclase [Burkholderia gladioli]|uniref:Polyketide cyclase n=1 Tax=Burkholderia gladioli TaxID=28095 RepID=A0A2A7SCM2_BURGA|nr:ester cyclase [Burkholderia gladioli]MBU9424344.1 ester cyclase [Burkholderia gladioli]MDC6130369.1 ester cyclase [Burkholderia gladioli]MDN8061444.1 ester cyclase [Burkholderia gladioli]PEH40990.1 polyketide cyclase [Burkholderia gladioli]QPQ87971.1 ester cyclase [Burkholderia gladioli]